MGEVYLFWHDFEPYKLAISQANCVLQPWYAKKAAEPPREENAVVDNEPEVASLALVQAVVEKPERRESKRDKRKHKDKAKKKDKDKRKDKHKSLKGRGDNKPEKSDLFAALRAEREAREGLERKRANQAVLDSTFNADGWVLYQVP